METEIKLSPVPQAVAENILGANALFISEKVVYSMSADYYDTPERDLKKAGLTLRLRHENNLSVCCLKYRISDISRFEAEENASDIESGISALCLRSDVAESIKTILKKANMRPIYSSSFERVSRLMQQGESVVELSFDYGFLRQEDRFSPISEMELELKEGSQRDLLTIAERLCNEYKLPICNQSKAQRAAGLTEEAFSKMIPVTLEELSVNEIFSGNIFIRKTAEKTEAFIKN